MKSSRTYLLTMLATATSMHCDSARQAKRTPARNFVRPSSTR